MGADDQVDCTLLQSFTDFPGFVVRCLSGEKSDPIIGEKGFGFDEMLSAKYFSGGQKCSLLAGMECGLKNNESDDGFSAANIAAEQALHGAGAGNVVKDFFETLFLSRGKCEGQLFSDGQTEPVIQIVVMKAGSFTKFAADQCQLKVKVYIFLVGQPISEMVPGFDGSGEVFRPMNGSP